MSLQQGKFPEKFKIAKIIPIHKKGDPKDINNYRPISHLSSFSKILEKIVHCRLSCFLEKHNFFSKFRFGFRENHSTELAVSYLVSEIANTMENGFITIGIFLDLSKAFDTINHQILLTKLHHYGIKGNVLNWFASYLLNQQQYSEYGNAKSSSQILRHGVPQGSILGPLLF